MSETRTLVEFLSGLEVQLLPANVIERAKVHILDTLAVAAGGSTTEHARQAVATLKALGTPGNSTVIANDLTVNVLEAAFLNGVMAHSIDFDDAHKFVHPGAAIVPAALAFAESQGAHNVEFLKAVICGYEAAVRVSLAGGPSHRARGFHPTGTCNVIGTAVAAGVLLKLDAHQIVSAVGIAASQAAGLTQYRIDGAATKHLHAGFAARAGGFAALLAREGLRGPEASIEGEVGFLKAFADEADPEALTRGLGKSWAIATTDIKPYPSCRQTHAPLDLMLNLMRQNSISHEQIEAIRLATYKYVDKPWHVDTSPPGSSLEGMLSIPYCLATAAVYGQVTLTNFGDAARADTRVCNLLRKISIGFDEDMTARWPAERGAAITLVTSAGTFEARASNPRGGGDQPVEWPEAVGKARGLTEDVLGPRRAEQLVEAVSRVDQPGSASSLAALLVSEEGRHG